VRAARTQPIVVTLPVEIDMANALLYLVTTKVASFSLEILSNCNTSPLAC
jgi:hypothetical protein